MIKAVLFDMDGVLIDAKEWHYETLNSALALLGLNISRTEHLAVYDGLPTKDKLKMLTKVRGLSPKLHDFLNAYKQKLTYQAVIEKCRPVFHHEYALARLKREGKYLAVCSNSIRATVQSMMEQADLLKYLDFFVSNQDVSKAKPDPEIYLTAINRLGFKPEEVLILEDNDHGIQAARASGAHVFVVGTPNDVTYDRIMNEINKIEAAA
ncbi:HAD family phosphatase [Asticcacaulis sp. YBE204]|uniref:HAD family hydrolase n=1 Tax=Asticcacaulis sp. YBE204 TaxID=1282363 RepID=UPI0003C3F8A7|nr:HAD family phosphatase [Asticcacaulis sp. YBE204]ESQ78647.1 HAD family hydrolase [Asticcacaulis sp. YBE204]